MGERGAGLSGGERQRITIARAILKDAGVVVLDEATAFADPECEADIQDAISALVAGRTLIVVAHRLSTIAGADQIVVVDAGRVVDHGTHDVLLARCGLYRRMWEDHLDARRLSVRGPAPVASP
ncbi:MAG: ATP-binding cassette domain-containing protein [Egibacteraceae bacterium]